LLFDVDEPLHLTGRFGHNRWHPDIQPLAHVQPGQNVMFSTRDGSDCQITADAGSPGFMSSKSEAMVPLTGPFFVEGAEPGDVLRVEVLEIEPAGSGATVIWPGSGFGVLPEDFTEPLLVRWQIRDGCARSDELPGITIRGAPFLGVMGVAPSPARLAEIAAREARLAEDGFAVQLPTALSAIPDGPPAAAGLRTLPPRETGGNLDMKYLTAGSVLTLPVDVRGALFSAGDCHFAQGDGEVTGNAIEIAATARLRFDIVKPNVQKWVPRFPSVEYDEPARLTARRFFSTVGLPIDASGGNAYMDLALCAQQAVREMIAYLAGTHGLTREQAYVLIGVAGDLRISEVVDMPNPIVSLHLPLDVFDSLANSDAT
jgi:formamidase